MRTFLPALLMPLALAGCLSALGECTYETRAMELQGTLAGPALPAGTLATARVYLAESRNGYDYRVISVYLTAPVAGSVVVMELRRAVGADTTPLLRWTQGNTTTPGEWHSNLDFGSEPSTWDIRFWAHGDQLVLAAVVGPGGAGGELAGTLRITGVEGWHHPQCS